MGQTGNSTGLPGEMYEPRHDDLIKNLILSMYELEGDEEDFELVSHPDLTDSIREVVSTAHRVTVFDTMIELKFKSKIIEGTVYWLVYSI